MRKFLTLSIFIFFIAIIGTGCKEGATELAFINGNGTLAINTIVWEESTTWNQANGYDPGDQTESKEVDVLDGEVEGRVWDGVSEFKAGTVDIVGSSGQNSLSLDEGSSEVYTITITQ